MISYHKLINTGHRIFWSVCTNPTDWSNRGSPVSIGESGMIKRRATATPSWWNDRGLCRNTRECTAMFVDEP